MSARLRGDLLFGAHPEDPERVVVMCPRTQRRSELDVHTWYLARAFDGRRAVRAIAEDSVRLTGRRWGLSEIRDVARDLRAMGFFELRSPHPRLPAVKPQWQVAATPVRAEVIVHPRARFRCEGLGTCCESGFVVRVSIDEAKRLRRAAGGGDPVQIMPTGRGTPATLALINTPECAFLEEDKRCRVHDHPAQPAVCRVFPFRFVGVEDRVFASVAHRCACGAGDRGELLSAQPLGERLALVPFVHTIDAHTRLDDATIIPTEQVLERTSSPTGGAFAMLRSLLFEARAPHSRARGRVSRARGPLSRGRGPLSESLSAALSEPLCAPLSAALSESLSAALSEPLCAPLSAALCAPLSAPLAPSVAAASFIRRIARAALPGTPLARAFSRAPHPHRATLRAHLDGGDPIAEVDRFIRDYIFGLQLYRYPTLASGVVAAGLAAARILRNLPRNRHAPATARERIMLWESALATTSLPAIIAPMIPTIESARAHLDALEHYSRESS